jgi:hypothetical protein
VAGSGRLTRGSVIGNGVVIGVWTLPWAACGVVQFDPWLTPWLFNPFGPFTLYFFLPMVYLADWCFGPLVLLITGLSTVGLGRSWRWRVAWIVAVVAGAAFELAAIRYGHLLSVTPYDAARRSWYLLAFTAGFILLAVVLALLAGSPRADLAAARAGLRSAASRAARTDGSRSLVTLGTVAIAAVIALVLLARGPGPVMRVASNGTTVTAIALSPNGKDLALADDGGDVIVSADSAGRPVLAISGGTAADWGQQTNALAFSPSGGVLALGNSSSTGGGGETQAWSTVTGRRIFGVPDPVGSGPVHAVAFSPDGTVIASGDKAGSVFLLDSATGRRLAWLKAAPSIIDSVAFSPDGRELASAAYDGTVSLWSTATGKVTATTTVPGVAGSVPDPASQPISVSFLSGGRTLTIGDARSGLYRWTAGAGQPTRLVTWTCGAGVSCENSLAVSPDGKSVVVTGQGAAGRDAYVWDLASGSLLAKISDPADYKVTSVAVSADGSDLAIGDDDGSPDTSVTFPPSAYVYKLA